MNEMELLDQEQKADLGDTDAQDLISELSAIQSEAEQVDGILSPENLENQGEAEQEALPTSDLLLGIINPLFDVVTPNWGISSDEKIALANAYGSLVDKYFPDGVHNQYGVEITALLVTATVFGSRAGVPRVLEEKEVNKESKTTKPEKKKESEDFPESGSELGAT